MERGRTIAIRLACWLLTVAWLATRLPAQCPGAWLSRPPRAGPDGPVLAQVRLQTEQGTMLVVGGRFGIAGNHRCSNMAAFDPAANQWTPFTPGVSGGEVRALCVDQGGRLVIGGAFSLAGGTPAASVAVWDGASLIPMGLGFDGPVNCLALLADGRVLAGGEFTTSGSVPCAGLAVWNGVSWSEFGGGVRPLPGSARAEVHAISSLEGDDLLIGGSFSAAGGTPALRLARWNGVDWQSMGSGIGGDQFKKVTSLARLDADTVVVGGRFTSAGGVPANNLAKVALASMQWSSMGLLPSNVVEALHVLPGGELAVGCSWVEQDEARPGLIIHADGHRQSLPEGLPGPIASFSSLAVGQDIVLTAGRGETGAGSSFATSIASCLISDGVVPGVWRPVGPGLSGPVHAMAELPGGDLVCAGDFLVEDGEQSAYAVAIFRRAEQRWELLGTGTNGPAFSVTVVDHDGSIVVGGLFSRADGANAPSVARWRAGRWESLGDGPGGMIVALASRSHDDSFVVYAGGYSTGPLGNIARFDSATGVWSPMGQGLNSIVRAILPDDATFPFVVAGGDFRSSGVRAMPGVATWWPATDRWQSVGYGLPGPVHALAWSDAGFLVAGGEFAGQSSTGQTYRNVAVSSGAPSWAPPGFTTDGTVRALGPATGQGLELYMGGDFSTVGTLVSPRLARVAAGVPTPFESPNGPTLAIVTTRQGMVAAAGDFSSIGGEPAGGLAIWQNAPSISIRSTSADLEVCEGQPVRLDVDAISPPPLSYRWLRDGQTILPMEDDSVAGERSSSLTMNPALPGVYACVLTNQCEEVTTAPILVRVISSASCPADFNGDGGVDGGDVEAFMLRWQGGMCDADVNRDGGVDGGDVEAFFLLWQQGGC